MEAAKNGLERIVTCVSNLNFLLKNAKDGEMTEQHEIQRILLLLLAGHQQGTAAAAQIVE